jgi:hypothetical protein
MNEASQSRAEDLRIKSGPDTTDGCNICLQHLIQKRAYELYEARGRKPGGEREDWLRAEKEIKHHFNL